MSALIRSVFIFFILNLLLTPFCSATAGYSLVQKNFKNQFIIDIEALQNIVYLPKFGGYEVYTGGDKPDNIAYKIDSDRFCIYPNLPEHKCTIKYYNPKNPDYNVHIYDISGKLVYNRNNIKSHICTIKGNLIKNGVYLIKLTDSSSYTQKIIIE